MLGCHSCYIYGTCRSKELGGLKSLYGGKGRKSQRKDGGRVMGGFDLSASTKH